MGCMLLSDSLSSLTRIPSKTISTKHTFSYLLKTTPIKPIFSSSIRSMSYDKELAAATKAATLASRLWDLLDMDFDDKIQLPFTWQCQLYNLENLTLARCWWHDLKSLYFPRLKVLKVDSLQCSALFSFSSFKSLEQLEELKISNCSLLEEVVEDVSQSMDKQTSTLPQLKSIQLDCLPNLKSISRSVSYAFHMPNLKRFCLTKCPQADNFTSLKTGTVLRVTSDWDNAKEVPDLTEYLRENRERENKSCNIDDGAEDIAGK